MAEPLRQVDFYSVLFSLVSFVVPLTTHQLQTAPPTSRLYLDYFHYSTVASSPSCAATRLSLTLISSSHGWVRFLMHFSVYTVGRTGDLLLVSHNIPPATIVSFSSHNEAKKEAAFPLRLSFLRTVLLKRIVVRATEDVLLRHKSQRFTALTRVLLCGCRKILEMSQKNGIGGGMLKQRASGCLCMSCGPREWLSSEFRLFSLQPLNCWWALITSGR